MNNDNVEITLTLPRRTLNYIERTAGDGGISERVERLIAGGRALEAEADAISEQYNEGGKSC